MSSCYNTQENILFLSAKLVPGGKTFGKGDGFPDSAETPSQKDFNDVLRLLSGEVFPAMLPKFVKLLWGPLSIVIYSSQVVQEILVRHSDL